MDKVTFIELANLDGSITEYAIIDRGNEEFTSMLKSTYEAMLQAQENPPMFPITTAPPIEQTQEGAE